MVSPDWVSAGADVAAAFGTVGTLIYAVRAANAPNQEELRISFFKKFEKVASDHPGVEVRLKSLDFRIENLGQKPCSLVEGALSVKQLDGNRVKLYTGLPTSLQVDQLHKRAIVIQPGDVYQGAVIVHLDEIKNWLPNRSKGPLWFDRPLLRVQTSRGKVFEHRLSESLWNHLQNQTGWKRHYERYPFPPPDPDFEDEEPPVDEDYPDR